MAKLISVSTSAGILCYVNVEKIAYIVQPNANSTADIVFSDGLKLHTKETAEKLHGLIQGR